MATGNNRPAGDTAVLAASGSDRPHELDDAEHALTQVAESSAAGEVAPAPGMLPPTVTSSVQQSGAWVSGQLVNALWANASPRNAYMHLVTAGWKKLGGLGDTGSTTMTLLAAHARRSGKAPTFDENPTNTAATMYVW